MLIVMTPPFATSNQQHFESATGRQAGKRLINVSGEVLLVPQVGTEAGFR